MTAGGTPCYNRIMKTTVHLVRHAEVENPEHIIYGRLPGFNLSKFGELQAAKLHNYFQNKNIGAIYTSPLLRCYRTAKIISGGKIPIHISKRVIEVDTRWEGLKSSERPRRDIELYTKSPTKINLGESALEVIDRMKSAVEKFASQNIGKEIIIVSHADCIVYTRLFYEGRLLDRLNQTTCSNASITSLILNDKLECEQSKYLEIVLHQKDNA